MSKVFERTSPPSPYWQFGFTHRGVGVRQSSKIPMGTTAADRKASFAKATEAAAGICADIDARLDKKVGKTTLAAAVNDYVGNVLLQSQPVLLALASGAKDPDAIPVVRNYQAIKRRLYAEFGEDTVLDLIDEDRIREWHVGMRQGGRRVAVAGKTGGEKTTLAGRGVSKASADTYMRALMTLLRRAHEQRKLLVLPVVKPGAKRKAKPQFLTEDEVGQVLAAGRSIDQRVERALLFFFGTGARKTEAFALEWKHVDLRSNGICRVTFTAQTKNDTFRQVPITDELRAMLTEMRAEQVAGGYAGRKVFAYRKTGSTSWMEPKAMDEQVQKIQELTGLATFHLHLCRHTYASEMLQAGARLEEVQRLLGHSNIATTQIYASLAQSGLDDVVARCAKRRSATAAAGDATLPLVA